MRVVRVVVILLSCCGFLMAAESPFSGTWKLNVSKSHVSSPAPKGSTAHVEVDGQNFKLRQEYVDDKNQAGHVAWDAKMDGKDYPVTGDPDMDAVAIQRVSERELQVTYKKAGKTIGQSHVIVSPDGKTTTLKYSNNKDGKIVEEGTDVYDKE
jgi:hypothetical protein